MGIERRKHYRFDGLSPEGQAIVRAGAEDKTKTLEAIRSELQAATGEEISTGALHRWITEQRLAAKLERQEATRDAVLASFRANPDGKAAKMLSLLLEEALLQKVDFSTKEADELLAELRAQQKMELAHRKVELGEQLVEAEKMKADAAQKKAEAALIQATAAMKRAELLERKLSDASKELQHAEKQASPDGGVPVEAIRRIRALFGITDEEASRES